MLSIYFSSISAFYTNIMCKKLWGMMLKYFFWMKFQEFGYLDVIGTITSHVQNIPSASTQEIFYFRIYWDHGNRKKTQAF